MFAYHPKTFQYSFLTPPPPNPKLTHTRARSLKVSVKKYHPRGRHLAQTVAQQLWIWGEGGHARKAQVPGWYFISQTPESVLGAQIFEQVQHKLMYANLEKGRLYLIRLYLISSFGLNVQPSSNNTSAPSSASRAVF